jgi:hypothetical protein
MKQNVGNAALGVPFQFYCTLWDVVDAAFKIVLSVFFRDTWNAEGGVPYKLLSYF